MSGLSTHGGTRLKPGELRELSRMYGILFYFGLFFSGFQQATISVLPSPLLDLVLGELSQIVDVGDFAGDGTLDHLDATADESAFADGVCCGDGFDLDDADAWVVFAAVVDTVA